VTAKSKDVADTDGVTVAVIAPLEIGARAERDEASTHIGPGSRGDPCSTRHNRRSDGGAARRVSLSSGLAGFVRVDDPDRSASSFTYSNSLVVLLIDGIQLELWPPIHPLHGRNRSVTTRYDCEGTTE
jgi:hypothetical protein